MNWKEKRLTRKGWLVYFSTLSLGIAVGMYGAFTDSLWHVVSGAGIDMMAMIYIIRVYQNPVGYEGLTRE